MAFTVSMTAGRGRPQPLPSRPPNPMTAQCWSWWLECRLSWGGVQCQPSGTLWGTSRLLFGGPRVFEPCRAELGAVWPDRL